MNTPERVHTFGLREDDLRELLLATLEYIIFQLGGVFYEQKQGFGMNLGISSLLAVINQVALKEDLPSPGSCFKNVT